MGFVTGIGFGLQFQKPSANTEGQVYASAAISDGFNGGSPSCSNEFFNELKSIS